jgi:hypothetical protein
MRELAINIAAQQKVLDICGAVLMVAVREHG